MKRTRRRTKSVKKKNNEDIMQEEIVPDVYDVDTTCNICYAEFLDPEDLKVHVTQVHVTATNQNRFCRFCSILLPSLEHFALHIRDVHINSMQCCKYCTRGFVDVDLCRKHEKKHYSYVQKSMYSCYNVTCSVCKKLFNNLLELQQHEYDFHKDVDDGIILKDCYPLLSSVLNIKAQTLLQSLDGNTVYICATCTNMSDDLNKYLSHLIKKKCRAFACNNCSYVYGEKKSLMKHFYKNSECRGLSKPCLKECHECHQLLDVKTFKKHVQNCKIIQCRPCNIVFDSLYDLSSHQTVKHPLAVSLKKCKYCRKDFVGVIAFEKHVERTHKHEKHLYKYQCNHCDENYIFKHPKSLFAHFYTKHKDVVPYTCKICDKGFQIRKKFSLHIKLEHKSIGHVVFDENFHVSFTDKPADKTTSIENGNHHSDDSDNTYAESVHSLNQEENETDQGESYLKIDHLQSETDGNITDVETKEKLLQEHENQRDESESYLKIDHLHSDTEENITERHTKRTYNLSGNRKGSETKKASGREQLKRKLNTTNKPIKKVKRAKQSRHKYIDSNDEDDEPLFIVKKRIKLSKKTLKRKYNATNPKSHIKDNKKRFVCNVCKKSCGTFQNYHRHLALHFKKDPKKCIKCAINFKNQKELNDHIASTHSGSKLTETLRRLLAKRKFGNVEAKPSENFQLTTTEKFKHTIKKVPLIRTNTVATITEVPEGDLSVQSFIENFTPETNEASKKNVNLDNCISIKPVEGAVDMNFKIKMTRFKPEIPVLTTKPKLAMPVKFVDDSTEKPRVSVKIVENPIERRILNFGKTVQDYSEVFEDTLDDNHYEEEVEYEREPVPEVAQEVMLEGTDETPCHVSREIKLSGNLTQYEDIKVAHLVPTAPYFKIVTVKNVLEAEKQPEATKTNPITLPSGMKLVNVNPLAHLIGDKPELLKPQKKYYKPKYNNFADNIVKALGQLGCVVEEESKKVPKKKKTVEMEQ